LPSGGKEKNRHRTEKRLAKGIQRHLSRKPTWTAEGEAIAWHLQQALGIPDEAREAGQSFNAITKSEIQKAFCEADADRHRSVVNAQQARRILDRIVGL